MHYQSQYSGVTVNVRIIKNENGEYILEEGYSHSSMIDFTDIVLEKQGYISFPLHILKSLAKENKIIGIEVNDEVISNCIGLEKIAERLKNNIIIKKLLHDGEYIADDNTLHIKLIHPIIPDKYTICR